MAGVNIEALMKNRGQREFKFAMKGQEWVFKMQELSWGRHLQIIEECWYLAPNVEDPRQVDRKFDLPKYYEDVLMDVIVELPDGSSPTRPVLRQLSSPVITKLITSGFVPSPLLNDEAEEVKKDSAVS